MADLLDDGDREGAMRLASRQMASLESVGHTGVENAEAAMAPVVDFLEP